MKSFFVAQRLTENKFTEFQVELGFMKWNAIFGLDFSIGLNTDRFIFLINLLGNQLSITWDFKCDHAGIHIMFQTWTGMINFELCDARHWDYDNNCWQTYDKE